MNILLLFLLASFAPVARAAGIHPLLLGSIADAQSPIASRVNVHAANLLAMGNNLTPDSAARYLGSLNQPLDAIAAGYIALNAARPEPLALPTGSSLFAALQEIRESAGPGLAPLADSARADAVVSGLFDGAQPSLELEGITLSFSRLKLGGEKIPELGRGDFGVVSEHPRVPGAVIKTTYLGAGALLSTDIQPRQVAEIEEATGRLLAAAGAGPWYLGRSTISGAPVSVRARIYGETIHDLILMRRFGPEEHALVMDLIGLMAAARVRVTDLRPSNIMIGTTWLDSRRKAYVVDSARILPVDQALPAETLQALIENQETVVARDRNAFVGWIVTTKPLKEILDQGLARTARLPFLARVKNVFRRQK